MQTDLESGSLLEAHLFDLHLVLVVPCTNPQTRATGGGNRQDGVASALYFRPMRVLRVARRYVALTLAAETARWMPLTGHRLLQSGILRGSRLPPVCYGCSITNRTSRDRPPRYTLRSSDQHSPPSTLPRARRQPNGGTVATHRAHCPKDTKRERLFPPDWSFDVGEHDQRGGVAVWIFLRLMASAIPATLLPNDGVARLMTQRAVT